MKYDSKIVIRCEDRLKTSLEDRAKREGMPFADFVRWLLRKETKGGE